MKSQCGFVFFYLFGLLAAASASATFGFLELFSQWQKEYFKCRQTIHRELTGYAAAKQPFTMNLEWTAEIQPVFSTFLERNTLSGSCQGLTRQRENLWEVVLNEDRSLSNY